MLDMVIFVFATKTINLMFIGMELKLLYNVFAVLELINYNSVL